MISPRTAPGPDRSVWWVGRDALPWREAFIQWLDAAASPRRPQPTWRIHLVDHPALAFPRFATRWSEPQDSITAMVVWAIPAAGITDLVHRIDQVRRNRPGYSHITAGLASPVERMLLSEIGVSAHVQHPRHWSVCRRLFDRWQGDGRVGLHTDPTQQ